METTIERKPSPEVVNDELYYYRARYMRPDLGRFVAMDPLGMVDGTNQFVYVQNDPGLVTDPYGWHCIPPLPRGHDAPPSAPTGNGGFFCWMKILNKHRSETKKSGRDKYEHCMAFCEIPQECGNIQYWFAFYTGFLREFFQQIKDPRGSRCDLEVNIIGSNCGLEGKNCHKCCIEVERKIKSICCE